MAVPASTAAKQSQQQPACLEAMQEPGLAQARADLAEVREENGPPAGSACQGRPTVESQAVHASGGCGVDAWAGYPVLLICCSIDGLL